MRLLAAQRRIKCLSSAARSSPLDKQAANNAPRARDKAPEEANTRGSQQLRPATTETTTYLRQVSHGGGLSGRSRGDCCGRKLVCCGLSLDVALFAASCYLPPLNHMTGALDTRPPRWHLSASLASGSACWLRAGTLAARRTSQS